MATPAPQQSSISYLDALLNQAERACQRDDYLPALTAALTIPDICGGLRSPNQGHGVRYRKWLTDFTQYNHPGKASLLWNYRCSMLHAGSAGPGSQLIADRIIFVLPNGPVVMHDNLWTNMGPNNVSAWTVDVPSFIGDMKAGVAAWKAAELHLPAVQRQLTKLMGFYPNGFPPIVNGIPVVT